jgi:hypothetical protein
MKHKGNTGPSESRSKALAVPAPRGGAANDPVFAGEAEEAAYWRGYHAALDVAAQPAPAGDGSARVRRIRADGFTGAKQAAFLQCIAAGFTTGEAAARAEISVATVYNFRNRREGRAFNIAWEAADRRSRRPLADRLRDRSLEGQTETLRDKDGALIGTRHRHDNRLAMAILTRLDKKAEAYREDERLVSVVAEELEELLGVIETGGDAEAFVEERRPDERDYEAAERRPEPRRPSEKEQLRRRYEGIEAADIDISDLVWAEHHEWTADQHYRADKANFFERYWAERDSGRDVDEHRPLSEAVRNQLGRRG